ncbi:MAG: transketolase C-terminal domain-containing protein [bacterium]
MCIGEDRRVLLPVAINIDGFSLSHVVEAVEFLSQEEVNRFLPPYQPLYRMHPDQPVTMGAFAMPELYMETKKAHDVALRNSLPIIKEVWAEWKELTGREYSPLEEYRLADAEVGIIAAGSICEVIMEAVDRLRSAGEKVGLLKLRLWRPFPFAELRQMTSGVKKLIVIDRALSTGGPGGPVFSEIRSALYDQENHPQVFGFIAGLGGRDVPPEQIIAAVDSVIKGIDRQEEYYLIGVRERG